MISVDCTCGRRFQTGDENAGKRTKCPVCGTPLVMPVPGADAASVKSGRGRETPPSWWYPKGHAEAPKAPAPQGFEAETARTRIIPSTRAGIPPRAETSSRPARWSRGLTIASGVGAIALLVFGLLPWLGVPDPMPGPRPKDEPVAANRGPSGPAPNPEIERPAVERELSDNIPLPPADGSPAERPPGPPVVSSEWEPRPTSNNATPEESAEEVGQPRMKLLVPAYFYPAGPGLKHWEELIDAAAHVPIVAVANPGSGPGEDLNPDYRMVVGRASRRGVTVIGYIGTNYAHRPRLEVEADVDRWTRFYPEIQGIFFDAQASDVGHVDDYAIFREFVRKKIHRALVVTNPGTLCAEEYASRPASDVFCMFESPSGFEHFRLPRWADRYTAGHFAALPHHVPSPKQMRDCIQVAASRGIGLIYVTDAQGPNLWDRLPSYWDAEVEAVRKVNQGLTP